MVDVLDNDYCEHNLTQNGTLTFVHKPEVLCVGLNISYNIRVYLKGSHLKNNQPRLIYKHVPRNNDRYKNLVSKEDMWYIVGKWDFFYHFFPGRNSSKNLIRIPIVNFAMIML